MQDNLTRLFQDFKTTIHYEFFNSDIIDENTFEKTLHIAFNNFLKRDFDNRFKVSVDEVSPDLMMVSVICNDMAFIVDSVINKLKALNVEIVKKYIPIFTTERDDDGSLLSVTEIFGEDESLSVFIIKSDSVLFKVSLQSELEEVMDCVFQANKGWEHAKNKVKLTISRSNSEQTKQLLSWLLENNFIFLGTFDSDSPESATGIFKTSTYKTEDFTYHFKNDEDEIIFSKSKVLANVHRTTNMDIISIRSQSKVINLVGFFTSAVYFQNVMNIPIVKNKIKEALNLMQRVYHSGYIMKEVMSEIQQYPRTELFQMSVGEIISLIGAITSVAIQPRVKIFVRHDKTSGFKSILVFIPKDKFSMDLQGQIENIICSSMSAQTVKKHFNISEGPLAKIQIIVRSASDVEYDLEEIQSAIEKVTWTWSDILKNQLFKLYDSRVAMKKLYAFVNAFNSEYIVSNSSDDVSLDIGNIEVLLTSTESKLFKFIQSQNTFKVYSKDSLLISDLLPSIENLGFKVIELDCYKINPIWKDEVVPVYLYKLNVKPQLHSVYIDRSVKGNLEAILENGDVEQDRFNSLIITAGLSWQDTVICRVYYKYMSQLGISYSKESVIEALVENPVVTGQLVALFKAKFSHIGHTKESLVGWVEEIRDQIKVSLSAVTNAAHDAILKCYLSVIDATKRTNFFKSSDEPNLDYMSFKIASSEIPFAPLPRPFMEIFVYSNRFEGVHLRGAKVARGGIRWSDRHLDYRTEVLGLMKAQMVKNSIIVPSGSKGGFVVKNVSPKDKENFLKEGVECYKLFLLGLLEITDNFEGNEVVRTKNSVCWDEVDPYLVVAADKGTASFSDHANTISLDHNFWLGDAFASGGSAGYDHKKLGITSRGAWISVRNHFSSIDIDPNKEEITVVGIGDMSGDVFGNGLLMSNTIKLVAAFNHMHIFIDPSPEAGSSYLERKRLFEKPRSQWSDYNKSLISKGGGVFERSSKSIQLNDEIRSALGINKSVESLSPDELIQAILKAPVDLIWNGGIGTYVKSSLEANEQVGDKANDSLRVNGKDLRCKVFGEGGNLGFTQLGRVEYARNGGHINTDAIDNSGGVDCSDHEVNLKILFNKMMSDGVLTLEERNEVLAKMSDEVVKLVLADNHAQNLILRIEESQGSDKISEHNWFMKHLEEIGLLNRAVEKLPSEEEMEKMVRSETPLTRPDLCVLLAYAKNSALIELHQHDEISELLDKEPYRSIYRNYFPATLQNDQRFSSYIDNHRLKREIMTTVIVNDLVNTMGCTYFHLAINKQEIPLFSLIKAFCIVKYGLGIDSLWNEVLEIEDSAVQVKLFRILQIVISRNVAWLTHNNIDDEIFDELKEKSNKVCDTNMEYAYFGHIVNSLKIVPDASKLAKRIACLYLTPDVVFSAAKNSLNVDVLADKYFATLEKLRFAEIIGYAENIMTSLSYDSKITVMVILRSLEALAMKIAVQSAGSEINLESSGAMLFQKYCNALDEIQTSTSLVDFIPMLLVLKRRLRMMVNIVN